MNVLAKINAGHFEVNPPYPRLIDFDDPKLFIEKKQQFLKKYNHLRTRLKTELLEEFKLTDHPNADKLFDIAWELGAKDTKDVYIKFEMLSELLK